MRTYSQLSTEEQAKAEKLALQELLEAIVEGGVRFTDDANKDDLQARIDKAFAESERMQTPWFAGEMILEAARPELEALAKVQAEDALYPGPNEHTIQL